MEIYELYGFVNLRIDTHNLRDKFIAKIICRGSF